MGGIRHLQTLHQLQGFLRAIESSQTITNIRQLEARDTVYSGVGDTTTTSPGHGQMQSITARRPARDRAVLHWQRFLMPLLPLRPLPKPMGLSRDPFETVSLVTEPMDNRVRFDELLSESSRSTHAHTLLGTNANIRPAKFPFVIEAVISFDDNCLTFGFEKKSYTMMFGNGTHQFRIAEPGQNELSYLMAIEDIDFVITYLEETVMANPGEFSIRCLDPVADDNAVIDRLGRFVERIKSVRNKK